MSRCFPYPPPGYVRNVIRDEALIESIKLQREGEKVKKERKKDKKREKREKEKGEKREKEKARGIGEIECKKHSRKKRRRDDRNKEDQKGGDLQKRRENETEQLEKSSLTEEHGNPVESQNSSDSTLNSNKRQKLSLPPDGRHNSGSIIRIRLPLQRHRDPEVLPCKEQPCTALGRIDEASIEMKHEHALRPGREGVENPSSTSEKIRPELATRLNKEKPGLSTRVSGSSDQKPSLSTRVSESSSQKPHLSTSVFKSSAQKPCLSTSVSKSSAQNPCLSARESESSAQKPCFFAGAYESSSQKPCSSTGARESSSQMAETSVLSRLCGGCPPELASSFRDVIGDWVPPPIQSDSTDIDDQDWLFETKRNQRSVAKRCELDSFSLSHADSTTWPRVCYLPEAEVFALPFTVPF